MSTELRIENSDEVGIRVTEEEIGKWQHQNVRHEVRNVGGWEARYGEMRKTRKNIRGRKVSRLKKEVLVADPR